MGVKVTGDAELLANLNKLQFGVAKETRAAVRDGARKFADKLKSNTPEWDGETDMSGHLRDDIKLSSVRETSGLTEVDVGYGKNTGWRAHFPNSGTSMQDPQHFIEETQEVMRPVVIAAFLSHLKKGGM
ncbi:HK97-gp10 family putative phage morphogenesis protein [Lacticaseibacillus paracasei]|uniref:HK97-gp10 family putative phage morphogenesis protein n=1 Tax=Lacticaseibacillus paracasei TaxID=1597 RepID=UPI0040463DD9